MRHVALQSIVPVVLLLLALLVAYTITWSRSADPKLKMLMSMFKSLAEAEQPVAGSREPAARMASRA